MRDAGASGRRAAAVAIALAVARGCASPTPEEAASPEDASPVDVSASSSGSSAPGPSGSPPVATSAPAAAPKSIAREDFVDALVTARCESVVHCCADAGKQHDAPTCRSHFHGREKWEVLAKSAKAYDPTIAARCISDLRTRASTSCDVDPLTIDACARVLGGIAARGAPCDSGLDCAFDPAGTAFCEKSGSSRGRCMTLVPGKAGAACIGDAFVPKGDEASQCNTDPALHCDDRTKACAPRTKDGEKCRVNDECFEGSRCTGRCTPTLAQGCKKPTDCAGGQRCDGGTCKAGGPVGATCAGATDCLRPALCDVETKRCVPPDAANFCAAP